MESDDYLLDDEPSVPIPVSALETKTKTKTKTDVVYTPSMVLFWNGWLSNWFSSPFVLDKIKYSCVEQYMMAKKAQLFRDQESWRKIMKTENPAKIKALGRKIKKFDEKTWEKQRLRIVQDGSFAKYSQNYSLWKLLDDTGDRIIVEASPYDKIWGIGLALQDPKAQDPTKWKGSNLLGICIMHARSRIRDL